MLYPDINSQKKTQQTRYRTALYLRLSREDGDKTESDSVANQRTLLEAYAADHPEDRRAAKSDLSVLRGWRFGYDKAPIGTLRGRLQEDCFHQ